MYRKFMGGRSTARLAAGAALAWCAVVPPAAAAETRCGWIHNPTPANWSLVDAIGEWILSTQGNYEAAGMDLMPDLSGRQFVRTNGWYGYACGCIAAEWDPHTRRAMEIARVTQKPLSSCRRDKDLPKAP